MYMTQDLHFHFHIKSKHLKCARTYEAHKTAQHMLSLDFSTHLCWHLLNMLVQVDKRQIETLISVNSIKTSTSAWQTTSPWAKVCAWHIHLRHVHVHSLDDEASSLIRMVKHVFKYYRTCMSYNFKNVPVFRTIASKVKASQVYGVGTNTDATWRWYWMMRLEMIRHLQSSLGLRSDMFLMDQ